MTIELSYFRRAATDEYIPFHELYLPSPRHLYVSIAYLLSFQYESFSRQINFMIFTHIDI